MNTEATTEFRAHLAREVAFTLRQVRKIANTISTDTGHIARRTETTNPIFNELGELQGQAAALDTACARYMTAARLLKDFDAFDKEYER